MMCDSLIAVVMLTLFAAAAPTSRARATGTAQIQACDCANDSAARNKATIRRLYTEVLAEWNLALVDEIIDPEFVDHVMGPDHPKGPPGFRALYANMRAGFPDLKYGIEDIIAEGDKVVVRWSWAGTHRGTYMGVSPSGRLIRWSGVAIYRLANGRAVERWVSVNNLALARALGRDLAPIER